MLFFLNLSNRFENNCCQLLCLDGRLNQARFVKAYESLNPESTGSSYSSYVFQAFDKDKSGFIDFTEFLTSLFFLSDSGTLNERLRFVFKIIDIGIYSGLIINNYFFHLDNSFFDSLNYELMN